VRTSHKGIDLIKKWEGLSTVPYLCPANIWTIGYGHTGGVKPTDSISKEEAELLLQTDLLKFEKQVLSLIIVPLRQEQFDALVSFTFNLGASSLQRSTLRMKLNRGDYNDAADEFLKWVWAGGKKLPGLLSRRIEERALFLS